MPLSFKRIERTSVSSNIIEQIKDKILAGEIKPGERFPPERVLAETLSVGRTSVREAVRALQYIGILEVRCGEGIFLSKDPSILTEHFKASHLLRRFSVMELVEARKIVEGATVYLATQRSSHEDREFLQELHRRTEDVLDDEKKFLKADFNFHRKIAEMSHNSVLVEMFSAMRELTLEENLDVVKKQGQIPKALSFHEKILKAILMCDPDEAREQMLAHLENIEHTVIELYEKRLREEGGDSGEAT
jgi:GntR family transcriptional repressor for pyruvate dehydrogenase complex